MKTKKAELTGEINFKILLKVIGWRCSRKKYLGRSTHYLGKRRKIIGEDFETVRLSGVKNPVNKTSIVKFYEPKQRKHS